MGTHNCTLTAPLTTLRLFLRCEQWRGKDPLKPRRRFLAPLANCIGVVGERAKATIEESPVGDFCGPLVPETISNENVKLVERKAESSATL
jgi:hypothetical protein